ncbi:hypothetical protein EDB19DRAFT_2027004 [Suillus lakei]|nr:hypothetical protein EDB19DRAFT_2027004 [Suillus lakei]
MSQVHHLALGLLDLPVEILLDILDHLDVYELVRARQICKDVQQAINFSSELLYSMDLEYFNAIPVPSTPGSDCTIPTLRKSLLQSESAWQNAQYSKRDPISIPCAPYMHRWSGGVLGIPMTSESLQQIKFFQNELADNHSNTTNLRQWSCQIDNTAGMELTHYNFSTAQDLVVLLARAPPGESHAYNVIFKSISEDKIHPEATTAVVSALDNVVDLQFFDPITPKSSIFGDYYGVLFKNVNKAGGGVADFLQIWNWKSKDTFQCLESFDPVCETMSFSFLTNEKLLVANARELLLYSLVHSANAMPSSLPPNSRYKCISMSLIPFHTHTHNQIVAISMDISRSLTHNPCFTSYVERNTLLEFESTYTSRYGKASKKSSSLPWSSWGPNHTRTFEERSYDPTKHSIFGFRSVSLVGSPLGNSARSICIRDFNPHRVVDFKAGNGTSRNQQLIEGEISPSSSLFSEPLGSGLPYIETITEEKFTASDIIMEANRVTLLSFEFVSTIVPSHAGEQSFIKCGYEHGFEVLDFE